MSKRTPILLLEDILDSAQRIVEYTDGMTFQDFSKDNKTIDAVIRNFEIIGEAAHLLPDHLKETYSSVDWFRIRGFRNRIVHDYFGVDIEIVWKIGCEQIPELITKVSNILRSL